MMKIVVCVKQVPEDIHVSVDPVRGTLERAGARAILNPFCEYALDQAIWLRHAHPETSITALSMGPSQATQVLRRCLELGADYAILLSDVRFSGADSWATAYTLATAIRALIPDVDLILLGKQAIDGDTAQVGPELAEILNVPQVTSALSISMPQKGRKAHVTRECELGQEVWEVGLPALVTCSRGEPVRWVPSLADMVVARQKPIRVLGSDELGLDPDYVGLAGSFTQVVKVFAPPRRKDPCILQNLEAVEAARQILAFLRQQGLEEKIRRPNA